MKSTLFALTALVVAVACTLIFGNGVAWADQAYHTERLPFMAVNGAPETRAGQVINAHSNGPVRYAREGYMVNGAAANSTYDVVIQIYFASACAGSPDLALTTAQILTDANGQGEASHVFTPADVAPFNPPLTIHARWVLQRGGSTEYQTRCTEIHLD